ncbi:MAG: glycosyltransferase family 39 protein [Candidatus Omnitrophica bacterium]|nr:glycosyltransferase family 39 protein [Candidatus Omnitrophota bacterium]MDD5435931.1 glycosyltransferase family 39 protein [Candidatus Omnitrophota bacterium]
MILVICLKLALGLYGITWGNPDRWDVDDRLTAALRMVSEKTFFYSTVQFAHPVFYLYFLLAALVPYLVFLKLTGFDFQIAREAASASWLNLTRVCPDLASGMLISGRVSSLLLGAGTVLIVFFLARRIYGARAAIFSAIILTLNVGLLGTNYLIKNENLALFLIVLVLYIWSGFSQKEFKYKRFYLSCFLSGLAIGTKLDSAILLFGIGLMMLHHLRSPILKISRKTVFILASCIFLLLGILAGYPRLIVPVDAPMGVIDGSVKAFSILFSVPTISNIAQQVRTVALNLAASFNVVILVFLVLGIRAFFARRENFKYPAYPIFSILIPYFFINIFLYRFAATKFLVLSLPLLAVLAGLGFELFWVKMAPRKPARAALSILTLIYSLFYIVRADMVFAKDDTRYISTRWMDKNIPAGASIAILQQPELIFSSFLIGKYRVYYFGERLSYDNNPYPKMRMTDMKGEAFLKGISGYDYVVLSSWDRMAFETGTKDTVKETFSGNSNYELVETVQYDEDLFFNPRPSHTCPTIFIFKTLSKERAS